MALISGFIMIIAWGLTMVFMLALCVVLIPVVVAIGIPLWIIGGTILLWLKIRDAME